jgi:hypothetical protein
MTIDQYGLHLTKKEASLTATVIVLLGLLSFVCGYFWGKQTVIEGFTQKTSQESFNDQVDYLLTMQSFAAKNGSLPSSECSEDKIAESVETTQTFEPEAVPAASLVSSATSVEKSEPVKKIKSSHSTHHKHYAALAGFGKKAQAQQMVDRLKQRHVDVHLKIRVSKSASGKARKTWFQVVTPTCDSVQEVQDLIDNILRSEKIKRSDIQII